MKKAPPRCICFALGLAFMALAAIPVQAGENIVWNGPGDPGNTGQLRDDPVQWPLVQSLFPDGPSGNTVTVGGDVPDSVYGGVDYFPSGSNPAEATGNSVNINGGAINNDVFGGFAQSDSGTATATGNTVTISDGTISVAVSGGYAWSNYGTATATGNSVSVSGGDIGWQIFGGYARSISGTATANNNSVNISGGGVGTDVYGGYAQSYGTATANNNSVSVSDGDIDWAVFGSYAESNSGTASANNNSVSVSGGSVGFDVYGGYARSDSGTATATGNSVTLGGAPVFDANSGIYGGGGIGDPASDFFTGNTLNVWNYTGSAVNSVRNFQYYNFLLPASLQVFTTNTLTLGNGSGTDSEITGVSIMGGGSAPQAGDVLPLLNASAITGIISNDGAISGQKGVSLLYDFQLTQTADALTATVTGVQAHPQTKALSEAFLGGMALTAQGADLVADQGMSRAVNTGGSGFGAFGALSGGSMRYNTGSYVDMKSVSLMAGLAYGADITPGRLTLGAFFEYGNGNYDTYNSFNNAASVNGDGDAHYLGGGLLGRLDFQNTGPGRFYAEGSARMGSLHNEYDTSDLRDVMNRSAGGFDSSSRYYGLHLGGGYIWNITEKTSLDLYGKYFWTRQEGDSVTLSTDDPVTFKDADSHRLRLGGRFAYALGEYVSPYIGAAYEHEFDGEARATTYGYAIDAPDLKGGTGIGEIGLTIKPSTDGGFSLDLGVQGYTGKREGVTANVALKWEF